MLMAHEAATSVTAARPHGIELHPLKHRSYGLGSAGCCTLGFPEQVLPPPYFGGLPQPGTLEGQAISETTPQEQERCRRLSTGCWFEDRCRVVNTGSIDIPGVAFPVGCCLGRSLVWYLGCLEQVRLSTAQQFRQRRRTRGKAQQEHHAQVRAWDFDKWWQRCQRAAGRAAHV